MIRRPTAPELGSSALFATLISVAAWILSGSALALVELLGVSFLDSLPFRSVSYSAFVSLGILLARTSPVRWDLLKSSWASGWLASSAAAALMVALLIKGDPALWSFHEKASALVGDASFVLTFLLTILLASTAGVVAWYLCSPGCNVRQLPKLGGLMFGSMTLGVVVASPTIAVSLLEIVGLIEPGPPPRHLGFDFAAPQRIALAWILVAPAVTWLVVQLSSRSDN